MDELELVMEVSAEPFLRDQVLVAHEGPCSVAQSNL